MDLRQRQPICLQQVGCLAHNNAQMTLWKHQMIMLEIHQAITLNLGNPRINFIHQHPDQGIVTRHCSDHFQALTSSTTRLHSTWHQAHNQVLVKPKDIRVMGHCGKDMISPKEDMVDLKCSPLSNSQGMGRHPQAHLECLQHRLETIQSFAQHLPFPLLQDNFLAHLVDPPLASQRNDFRWLRNRGGPMLPGLPICPHCHILPMTNTLEIMRPTIHRTWAGPKAKPQSAWSKRNCPWSYLPTGCGSPTLVRSTGGRKYGWQGFLRRSIGPLSGDRTIWISCQMDPCTGRQRLQIFWRLSRPGCIRKISIVLQGFGDSGRRCF